MNGAASPTTGGEDGAAVDLALVDALEQDADVLADCRLVELLAELLDGVDLNPLAAVDGDGVADAQRAALHSAGRDEATVLDDEDVLDGHPERHPARIAR